MMTRCFFGCVVLLCLPFATLIAFADDAMLTRIRSVSLDDFEASDKIERVDQRRGRATLKPRRKPTYKDLRSAVRASGPNMGAALLSMGADPNAVSDDGDHILNDAIWNGHADRVQDLLEAGSNPNFKEKDGSTPFHYAIWHGNREVIALMLKYGADPNMVDKDGDPVLHYAVGVGRLETIEELLKSGADPNGKDEDGRAALFSAVWSGREEIVSLLTKYGADPNTKDDDGEPVLHYACWGGHLGKIKRLLNAGANPNLPDEDGTTALYRAVRGKEGVVSLLLRYGADPDATGDDGYPAIFYAVHHRRQNAVKELLAGGANPNHLDKRGQTPLHAAVWRNNKEAAELLLKYGADPLKRDASQRTPLDTAKRNEDKQIIALLEADRDKPVVPEPTESIVPEPIETLKGVIPEPIKLKPIVPPTILREPETVYGAATFSAPGGGQSLCYSPDSKQLIAGDDNGAIRFFNAHTGKLENVLNAHQRTVLGLTFIPKTRILVSAGEDHAVRFWDIDASKELLRLKNAHWGQGKALSVSPDGRLLNTGAYVWEIQSTKPLRLARKGREMKHLERHVGVLWSFFTPDSRFLVLSRNSKGIWVWDLDADRVHKLDALDQPSLKQLRWRDLARAVKIGDAEPDDLLMIASDQYTTLTGRAQQLKDVQPALTKVTENSQSLACSPDGQYVAGFGYNSRISVYDMENDRQFEHDGHTAGVLAVAASADGELIASGGNDKKVRIWARRSGKPLEVIEARTFVYSVCFSPDSSLLAIGDNSSNVYLWDLEKKTLESFSNNGRVTDLAFDREGDLLVSLGFDIHVLDVKTRKTRAKISSLSSQQGNIAFSRDGKFIVGSSRSMSATERFKVPMAWTLDGDELFSVPDLFSEAMGHRYIINAVAFSPDSKLLAASSQSAIRLWDMKKKEAVGEKMCGHTSWIGDMKFSPDGKHLATASWDGTARIWNVASGQQEIVIDGDAGRVSCIDFTPDGQLVTANGDGTVHLWDLPASAD